MYCKCGAPLAESDLKRKDVYGKYMDMCGDCYTAYKTYDYDLKETSWQYLDLDKIDLPPDTIVHYGEPIEGFD